jgi:hypothetical protein
METESQMRELLSIKRVHNYHSLKCFWVRRGLYLGSYLILQSLVVGSPPFRMGCIIKSHLASLIVVASIRYSMVFMKVNVIAYHVSHLLMMLVRIVALQILWFCSEA